MAESLSKKRGTCNLYIRHIENLENEIKETLVNFDINNSRHRERLKGLKYSLDDKMKKIAILDNEIFDLLEQKDAETELSNTLVRNDRIFGLIASIEETSNKNENNEVSLISNSSSTSNSDVDEAMCKLPKLVVKEFDGSVLNWQTFWNQFEYTIHSKTNISNIDKFGYLTSFLCKSAHDTISGLAPTNHNYLEAVQLLKNRYENPQLLINTYMKQFVQLGRIIKSNHIIRHRMFYYKVEIT